jgi:HlyD family secretion protein
MRAVYVLRDGRPHKTMVKPGDTDGAFTEILSGLEPGDKVITSSSREGN